MFAFEKERCSYTKSKRKSIRSVGQADSWENLRKEKKMKEEKDMEKDILSPERIATGDESRGLLHKERRELSPE